MGNIPSARRVADSEGVVPSGTTVAAPPRAAPTATATAARRWCCCIAADEPPPLIHVSLATPKATGTSSRSSRIVVVPGKGRAAGPGASVTPSRSRSPSDASRVGGRPISRAASRTTNATATAAPAERDTVEGRERKPSLSGNLSLSALLTMHTQGSMHSLTSSGTSALRAPVRKTKSMVKGVGSANGRVVKARTPSGDLALGVHKLTHLRNTPLGSMLSEAELMLLASLSELRAFTPGQMIYAQGTHPSRTAFLLCAGEVCVEVEGAGIETPLFASRANTPPPTVSPTTTNGTTPDVGGVDRQSSATSAHLAAALASAGLSPPSGVKTLPTFSRPEQRPTAARHASTSSLNASLRQASFTVQEEMAHEQTTPATTAATQAQTRSARRSTFTFASVSSRHASGNMPVVASALAAVAAPAVMQTATRTLTPRGGHSGGSTFRADEVLAELRDTPTPIGASAPTAAKKPRKRTLSVSLDTNQAAVLAAHGLAPDGTRLQSPSAALTPAGTGIVTPASSTGSGRGTPARHALSVAMPATYGKNIDVLPNSGVVSPVAASIVVQSPTAAFGGLVTPTSLLSNAFSPSPSPPPLAQTVFHRLALQTRGWVFGLEALWAMQPPPELSGAHTSPTITTPRARVASANSLHPDAASLTRRHILAMSTPPPPSPSAESPTNAARAAAVDAPWSELPTRPRASSRGHAIDEGNLVVGPSCSFPRLANVVAITDGMCLSISQQKLDFFYSRHPHAYQHLHACFGAHMESAASALPFLSHLSPPKLRLFLSLFTPHVVEANTVLFEESQPSTDESLYFFIHTGSVRIYLPTSMNATKQRGAPSSAKKRTLPTGRSMSANSVSEATSPISPTATITSGDTPRTAPPPPPPIGYLEKELPAGTFMGELALLLELDRTATAVTSTRCTLLTLSRKTLRNFLVLAPELLVRFREDLGSYHLQNSYLLRIPIVQEYFHAFCEREYSTENLDFVRACARFKKLAEKSVREAEAGAHDANQRERDDDEHDDDEEEVTPRPKAAPLAPYLIHMAASIYDEFVCVNAARQVNLRSVVRSAVAASLAGGGQLVTPHLFRDAVREIYALMAADSFARFRRSDLFQEALRKLNRAASVVNTAAWEEQVEAEAREALARHQAETEANKQNGGGNAASSREDTAMDAADENPSEDVDADADEYIDVKELNLPALPSSELLAFSELLAASRSAASSKSPSRRGSFTSRASSPRSGVPTSAFPVPLHPSSPHARLPTQQSLPESRSRSPYTRVRTIGAVERERDAEREREGRLIHREFHRAGVPLHTNGATLPTATNSSIVSVPSSSAVAALESEAEPESVSLPLQLPSITRASSLEETNIAADKQAHGDSQPEMTATGGNSEVLDTPLSGPSSSTDAIDDLAPTSAIATTVDTMPLMSAGDATVPSDSAIDPAPAPLSAGGTHKLRITLRRSAKSVSGDTSAPVSPQPTP